MDYGIQAQVGSGSAISQGWSAKTATERESRICAALMAADKIAAALREAVLELEQRFSPALTPNPPQPTGGNGIGLPTQGYSSLAGALEGYNDRVSVNVSQLRDIIQRCEL